ncbi:P-loop containing nucleoside triphosphate hydrolases superfamily protein [Hibiscus syriacus]|uniref:P-loop containing nucleoside triphosphate hydrolases superfamily protein n=1 Tax=Hibiscus syriacus TaxID=106335 RepID=A0A6A2ZKV0_HIBSY|nr:AAA-ATPase At3g28600-like [Hibiscus syriacus]KAE8691555.1 P-loop containing nucleoside triphosphate hydrolases superfamily protein [Hibiscus syriacus]
MMIDSWAQIGSTIAGLMFTLATLQQFFPHQLRVSLQQFVFASLQRFSFVQKLCDHFVSFFSPYIQITFPEYSGFWSNQAFSAIETYVGALSTTKASLLKGSLIKNSKALVLTRDDLKVSDEFDGVKVWWILDPSPSTSSSEDKYFQLIFHRQHRDLVTGPFLDHVLEQGKAIKARNKQRRLYTNNPSDNWSSYKKNLWSDIAFENPATFQTIAMDPKKKEEIINVLMSFSKAKEYYMKLGKPWKRGYLLYGPPGTGKSTMIAAMANLLNYDIYDLELTTVKNNTELRKLLTETSSKSIIVIEDIDCSLDVTGERKKERSKTNEKDQKSPVNENTSKVTLSGLLNFIDGTWSACGTGRIFVFTTNHINKLDPALIRRGRMDMHIELSYCSFEAFKMLAKNYLDLDSHELFEKIGILFKETEMTPADVAENLMPKREKKDPDSCLESLIEALSDAKEKAKSKTEKEKTTKIKEERGKKFYASLIKKRWLFQA